MDIEKLRDFCTSLPHVTEDIKWGNDLCFSIGAKMFCVAGMKTPLSVSFKVKDEEFEEMCARTGIEPAPYVARYKWVLVSEHAGLSEKDWKHYIRQSYELVKEKLPGKLRQSLN